MVRFLEYLRVRREIVEGENPEINTDRLALVSRFRALGFTGPLEGLLDKVDVAFAGVGDSFDLKSVIGLVRSALEQILQQSARRDAQIINLPDALGESLVRFAKSVAVCKETGLLTAKEADAIQGFYNMLSVEGAHAWGSAREQARLSKNMMIEWGVLILNRVRE